MTEHIVGAIQWRLKGQRLRFEPQNRPIALESTDVQIRKAKNTIVERLRGELVGHTLEMYYDQLQEGVINEVQYKKLIKEYVLSI